MKKDLIQVVYSREHGGENLPLLKDLVSKEPDCEKDRIISYLKTNCIFACPGIFYDEITPGEVIGNGHIFSDGVYCWNDVFINYVDQYNIPVPQDFRAHIMKNYSQRMERHAQLRRIDRVLIENNPCLGYKYRVLIDRSGRIEYSSNTDSNDSAVIFIKAADAAYIIDPIMTELFCYDSDNHGIPKIDGYHWNFTFYTNENVVEIIDGWPNEDEWRYDKAKCIMEFAERFIPFDLGAGFMNKAE